MSESIYTIAAEVATSVARTIVALQGALLADDERTPPARATLARLRRMAALGPSGSMQAYGTVVATLPDGVFVPGSRDERSARGDW